MDSTIINAFIPLLTAILTEAIQIVVEVIKGRRWHEVRWWRSLMITSAAALVATTLIVVVVRKTTDCAITNLGWLPYHNDGTGSTITVSPVIGSNCAFQVSFDLKKERAYVAAYQKLDRKFLAWWIKGLEFTYSGLGNPNTMELKLFDKTGSQYKVVRQHTTNTSGSTQSVTIPYKALTSATNGDPFQRRGFDLDRIDFTFSNWDGDTPGAGNVLIQDIRVVLAWPVWLIVFSPLLVLGLLVAYSLWQKPAESPRLGEKTIPASSANKIP